MPKRFTLEYWIDGGWFVGRLKEVPGVFCQGASLPELEANVRDAYRMMMAEEDAPPSEARTKELEIDG